MAPRKEKKKKNKKFYFSWQKILSNQIIVLYLPPAKGSGVKTS